VRAEVFALPPGHPYLRLPLQFATALEARLLPLVQVGELERLRNEGEVELAEPGRWGTTFTLIQSVGPAADLAATCRAGASMANHSCIRCHGRSQLSTLDRWPSSSGFLDRKATLCLARVGRGRGNTRPDAPSRAACSEAALSLPDDHTPAVAVASFYAEHRAVISSCRSSALRNSSRWRC
jgi:cytochrome c553